METESSYIVEFANNDNVPEERTSTRIRIFLDSVEPLVKEADYRLGDIPGAELIEDLARCCQVEKPVQWEPEDCAEVLRFLHLIKPRQGRCFCDDHSRINATCGFHAVLIFLEDQLRRIAAPKRRTKHAA